MAPAPPKKTTFPAYRRWWGWLLAWGLGWGLLTYPLGAAATETILQWQGDQGYRVEAILHYPEGPFTAPVGISGKGTPQNLEALTVFVYDPQGHSLGQYQNVTEGRSPQNHFLQLHFDPRIQAVQGWIDIGGMGRNDYFLKGQPGLALDLFYIDGRGMETKLDHNEGQITVSVPPVSL